MARQHVPTLEEWASVYLETRAARNNLRPGTISNYSSHLRRHIIPALGHKRLNQITGWDLEMLLANVRKNSIALDGIENPGAVNAAAVYRLIRPMMKAAAKAGHIPTWDAIAVPPEDRPRGKGPERPDWTMDDYYAVRDHLTPSFRRVADVTLGAGLRRGETIGLEWGDWDPGFGTLFIQRQGPGGDRPCGPTKTGERAKVKVQALCAEALAERPPWATDHSPVFPGARSARVSKYAVDRAWKAAREAAGLPTFHFHDLKALAATMYGLSGATVREIMRFTRHQDERMAIHYQRGGSPERLDNLKARADELMRRRGAS